MAGDEGIGGFFRNGPSSPGPVATGEALVVRGKGETALARLSLVPMGNSSDIRAYMEAINIYGSSSYSEERIESVCRTVDQILAEHRLPPEKVGKLSNLTISLGDDERRLPYGMSFIGRGIDWEDYAEAVKARSTPQAEREKVERLAQDQREGKTQITTFDGLRSDYCGNVSRVHGLLVVLPGQAGSGEVYYYIDLFSVNGTSVLPSGQNKAQSLSPGLKHEVHDGDRLHLANNSSAEITVKVAAQTAKESLAPPPAKI